MDVEKLLKELTLEEKASLVSGHDAWRTEPIERLGIPYIFMSDGPHGVRKEIGEMDAENPSRETIDAVCFPTASASSCSFDRELMKKIGSLIGKECQAEDVSTILGPAMNIKRSPLCGRNFEYISEDPYVAGELASAFIDGVQAEGVGTSVKHFAANSQETERMYADSVMDERTLREIYLSAFETAVKKSNPATVMCSYNRVNGTYASENKYLLTDILRKEWGFDGLVMSDWGAVSDRVKGIDAGLDLEMPGCGGRNDQYIIESVKNGKLSEEALDAAVRNVLNWVDKMTASKKEGGEFDRDKDHKEAVKAAEECIVLLQNLEPLGAGEKVLPLKKDEKVVIIGGFAAKPRYQGGGSSHINSHEVTSSIDIAKNYSDNITYFEGFPADSDEMDEDAISKAIEAAKDADKVVIFAGLPDSYESEGYDREHMQLPQCQNDLIDEIAFQGKPVVVVLQNGSPVEMPWVDYVDGIVEAYLGGEGIGEAVMNVLYGRINPSGHLSETFPLFLEDNPSFLNFPVANHKVKYAEGVFVGYRYYDTKCMDVLFPFGHGLSYTDFELTDLRIISGKEDADSVQIDINEGATIRADVKNIGDRAGKAVVQLYISDKTNATNRPVHELKGFEKVSLEPGETKTVEFKLDARSFQWFSEQLNDWYAASGKYVIQVGFSSREIWLEGSVELAGNEPIPPVIDADVQLGELMEYPPTAGFIKGMHDQFATQFGGGETAEHETKEMVEAMTKYMPIRTLRSFAGLTNEQIAGILEGLRQIVGDKK